MSQQDTIHHYSENKDTEFDYEQVEMKELEFMTPSGTKQHSNFTPDHNKQGIKIRASFPHYIKYTNKIDKKSKASPNGNNVIERKIESQMLCKSHMINNADNFINKLEQSEFNKIENKEKQSVDTVRRSFSQVHLIQQNSKSHNKLLYPASTSMPGVCI